MEVSARGLRVDGRGPREREESRMTDFSPKHPGVGDSRLEINWEGKGFCFGWSSLLCLEVKLHCIGLESREALPGRVGWVSSASK